jgi:hypothetical protein
MDTADLPSLGRLSYLQGQLACYNGRVDSVVSSRLDSVERLMRAATDGDWQDVLRLCQEVAAEADERHDKRLFRSARRLCDAMHRDPSGKKSSRQLAALLVECRAAKLRRGDCPGA